MDYTTIIAKLNPYHKNIRDEERKEEDKKTLMCMVMNYAVL